MVRPPRICVRLASLGCLAVLSASLASGQGTGQRPPEPVVPGPAGAASRPDTGNPRLAMIARLVPQYLADREWYTVAHALHMLRDMPPGGFVIRRDRDAAGKAYAVWSRADLQANRFFTGLPAEALKAYRELYGDPDAPRARELLARAKKQKDTRLLTEVVDGYLYTDAGPEALALLAAQHSEAGRDLSAALCYKRLLSLPGRPPSREVEARAEAALRKVSGQKAAAADWLLFQGNATRSGRGKGGTPDLGRVHWRRATILDRNDESGELDRGNEAKAWIDRALARAEESPGAPLLPGFFPLAAGNKVIYRTYKDITAVNLEALRMDGKEVAKAGEVEWKSTDLDGSLVFTLGDVSLRGTLEAWLREIQGSDGLVGVVPGNAALGTLSCDGSLVYAVDELAVPVPPASLAPDVWASPRVAGKVKPLVLGNSLHAFELETGKVAFRLGHALKPDEFTNSHFLGAPLPLQGCLYALNETANGEVRLVCCKHLNPGCKILSLRTLVTVQDRFVGSPLRRTQPVHLAYADGILVCPTNAGAVLGVDLATEGLVWAYTYREGKPAALALPRRGKLPPQAFNLTPEWRNSAPVIQDGKVVFTAPDDASVHCVNLRDGSLLWRVARAADDLYLAGVYGGKVLLVGNGSCRALALADGKAVWQVETGVPSGMGVAAGNTYYLPLRSSGEAKQAGICAIDMEKGRVVRTFTAAREASGNLLFHAGRLISQGPTSVTVYPLAKGKEE